MATRATITLKIKDEDLNKTKKFDIIFIHNFS